MRKIVNWLKNIVNSFVSFFKKLVCMRFYIETSYSNAYNRIKGSIPFTSLIVIEVSKQNIPVKYTVQIVFTRNSVINEINIPLEFKRNVYSTSPCHQLVVDDITTSSLQGLKPLEYSKIFQDIDLINNSLLNNIQNVYNQKYP